MTTAIRYHDFCAGHRVYGHESKCAHIHGHNYRVYFHVIAPELDKIGRVMDFSVIKSVLCEWIEEHWDHKFLVWNEDPLYPVLMENDPTGTVPLSFNPTAERLAEYLVEDVGPILLNDYEGIILDKVVLEETRKCSVEYQRE